MQQTFSIASKHVNMKILKKESEKENETNSPRLL